MPKHRDLRIDNISKFRYRELHNWCLQYNEWKGSPNYKNRELLESTLKQAIKDIYKGNIDIFPHMLEAITRESTFKYLDLCKRIPTGEYIFNKIRRRFYCLLDQEKQKHE